MFYSSSNWSFLVYHGWSPSSLDWLTGVKSKQKTGLCRVESISPVAILETLDSERRFQNSLILGFSFQRFIAMIISQYFRRFDRSFTFSFQWWPEEADMEWFPVRYCPMNSVTHKMWPLGWWSGSLCDHTGNDQMTVLSEKMFGSSSNFFLLLLLMWLDFDMEEKQVLSLSFSHLSSISSSSTITQMISRLVG